MTLTIFAVVLLAAAVAGLVIGIASRSLPPALFGLAPLFIGIPVLVMALVGGSAVGITLLIELIMAGLALFVAGLYFGIPRQSTPLILCSIAPVIVGIPAVIFYLFGGMAVLAAISLELIIAGACAFLYGLYTLSRYAFRVSRGRGIAAVLFPPYMLYFAFSELEEDGKDAPTFSWLFGFLITALLVTLAISSQTLTVLFGG